MDNKKDLKEFYKVLQLEEKQLKEILSIIQKEINKFEVEQMHLKSQIRENPSQSDESEADEKKTLEEIIAKMDNIEEVNQQSLQLDTNNTALFCGEEEEESD